MRTRKKAKRMALFLLCTIICCSIGGFFTVYARAGAAKKGDYSSLSAAYGSDGTGTIMVLAYGTNDTNATRYMTTSIQVYYSDGSLYDQTRVGLNTAPGVTRERKLEHIPATLSVWAQNILYTGTSVSTTVLESLRFKVN